MSSQPDTFFDLFQRHLPDGGKSRTFSAGETLFRRGDPVREIFLIQKGFCNLARNTVDGSLVVLQRASAGEVIAEASLFRDSYHCDGVVEQDADILVFHRSHVLAELERHSTFSIEMMAVMARQLVSMRGRLELMGVKSARERLWQYLLLSMDSERSIHFDVPYKQIASNLGLAHETLYRTLSLLEQEGLIVRTGSMIEII